MKNASFRWKAFIFRPCFRWMPLSHHILHHKPLNDSIKAKRVKDVFTPRKRIRVKARWRPRAQSLHHKSLSLRKYEGCEPFFVFSYRKGWKTEKPSIHASNDTSRFKNRLAEIEKSFGWERKIIWRSFFRPFYVPWGISPAPQSTILKSFTGW